MATATPKKQPKAAPKQKRSLVEIKKATEVWSEYSLADGTALLVRPAILEVYRLDGKFSDTGDPIYEVTGASFIKVRAPDKLKAK